MDFFKERKEMYMVRERLERRNKIRNRPWIFWGYYKQ